MRDSNDRLNDRSEEEMMGVSPQAGAEILVLFSTRMRLRRQALGLTQQVLGARCGLHWTYLGQVERGQRNTSLVNVARIAAGLETTPAELLLREALGEGAQ